MRYLAILAALIAIPVMAQTAIIQPPSSAPATITKTYTLQSGGKLIVSNVNGKIKITAWDKNEVALTANFKPDSNDKHTHIEVEGNVNALELIVRHPKGKNVRRSASCEMELKVPGHIVGKFDTVNGNVLLNAIAGDIKTNTVNGSVVLGNVNGRIIASTVNGNIKGSIQNAERMTASTVNGSIDIKLLNPSGSLSASAVNGSVKLLTPRVRDVEAKKNSTKAKFTDDEAELKFSTVNGSITIQ